MKNQLNIFFALLTLDCLFGAYALFVKKLDRHVKPLLFAVACSLLDEILGELVKMKYRNNLSVYYFSNPFEYSFFVWFIYANVNSKLVKKAIMISVVLLFSAIILFAYNFVIEVIPDPYSAAIHHNYFVIVNSLLITIFSICYFKGIFDSISHHERLNLYVLLAIAAILFYYAFSAVYFSAENYLVGVSLKENPNLAIDIFKRKIVAFTHAYQQLRDIRIFLFFTNMLLYLCALVVFVKYAVSKRPVNNVII